MQKITPHLWFDTQAHEAALFYTSLFDDGQILFTGTLEDTPSGDAQTVSFKLAGMEIQAISAGPYFKLNPSFSFQVHCTTRADLQHKWDALSNGGTALMPLDAYPFNPFYGWVQDRYGLSWQLMLDEDTKAKEKLKIAMLFSNTALGKTEAAIDFFTSLFPHSSKGIVSYYPDSPDKLPDSKINYAEFTLFNQPFVAMDHGFEADFTFNEAFSLMLGCADQAEIDHYWEKLSSVPEAEQCGWLKDPFGVSWQIVPTILGEYLSEGTPEQIARVTEAFLQMKKFDIATLEKAYLGT